jgi:hypothetical protein
VNVDCGILSGAPRWKPRHDALVLAFTPGIPLEWLYAALRLGSVRRRQLREMIAAADRTKLAALGQANAASVRHGDGWKMLQAVAPVYAGAAPLWSQIDLCEDRRSDGEIGRELGVNRQKVRRWRVNSVFCPLTGVRLVGWRGSAVDHSRL